MRWFTNLKTRSKLMAGFGIVIFMLLVVILTAWTSIYAVRNAESSIADVMSLRNNFNGQRAAMLAAVLLTTGTDVEAKMQEVADY